MVQNGAGVKRVLDKARTVVKFFHKSSWCNTEDIGPVWPYCFNDWSSTFNMVAQLLKVKDSVCQITNEKGVAVAHEVEQPSTNWKVRVSGLFFFPDAFI